MVKRSGRAVGTGISGIRPSALKAFQRSRDSGDLRVVAENPAARKLARDILAQVAESRAGSDAPSGRIPNLGSAPSPGDYGSIVDLLFAPRRVPIWDYDEADLEARSLPSDRYAELNVLALMHIYNHAATMSPEGPVTGSTTATGTDVTLSHPTAASLHPMVVPGFLIEFSLDNNTSQLGQITATLTGYLYGGGTPNLDANAATTADHYAATTADFATGSFTFVPRRKDKTRVLLTPYKVVNAKTFIAPAMLANIDTMASTALTAVLDTTAQPAGTLVEITALGVDHDFFRQLYHRLVMEID
jgi:hypothetical protein